MGGAGFAGATGALTAGIEALAVCGPDAEAELDTEGVFIDTGDGGGAVPIPNSPGDAVGDEGSASGADCAACCAFVRSATNEAVSFLSSSASGASGLAGTVARFG